MGGTFLALVGKHVVWGIGVAEVEPHIHAPGKPTGNSFIALSNGNFRRNAPTPILNACRRSPMEHRHRDYSYVRRSQRHRQKPPPPLMNGNGASSPP